MSISAFAIRNEVRGALRLTAPCNLSGMPAISIPAGFMAEGLPFGLQLKGRPFDEATLLGVADVYERASGWGARRPPDA